MFVGGRFDVTEGRDKVTKNLGGHHDGVTVSRDVFGNFHHKATWIAFQIKKEDLAVGEDFLGMEEVVFHGFNLLYCVTRFAQ